MAVTATLNGGAPVKEGGSRRFASENAPRGGYSCARSASYEPRADMRSEGGENRPPLPLGARGRVHQTDFLGYTLIAQKKDDVLSDKFSSSD